MNLFAFTRIKLTAWYVAAIMAVSIMFSGVVYASVTRNIEDVFYRAGMRFHNMAGLSKSMSDEVLESEDSPQRRKDLVVNFFTDEITVSRRRVLHNLFVANFFIFILSSVVSYVLASKTLKPIEEIVLEQKRFIADASHELRTPLTSLKTSIEVSLRDKSLDKKTKKILKGNLEDVNSLQELIDSLLQLASQENKTIVKQLIDIHEVVTRAIKTVRPLADNKQVRIIAKLKHQQVLASEASLVQLFTILLDNAVKYSNHKGEVTVEVVPRKRYLLVKVSDNGIGINKKYLPHIFDRFYRVDSSRTSSQRPGFGLGLSVAKQIVENHQGSICVNSTIGKGTSFTVRLNT